ncbi:MAG: hypothetical protein K2O30_07135 [Duncaniella sp.]|nr:hypothetical protein [Duncaniella sp.]MDE7145906.1 hypothetical protein [Duncaniella sp.]
MRVSEKKEASGMMSWLLGMALGLLVLAMLCVSCSPTKYVETVRTEYVEADTTGLYERMRSFFESTYRRETSSDSIIDRTKETVVLRENGDTARHDKERIVYVASHREKELEHKLLQQDSTIKALRLQLASVKSDSIPVPYPVEKELSGWEQTKMDFGGIAIVAFIAVICVAVAWLIRKFRK